MMPKIKILKNKSKLYSFNDLRGGLNLKKLNGPGISSYGKKSS